MKKKNNVVKLLVLVALVAGLASVLFNWQTTQVQAIQDSEDRPNPFAFLELAVGQTARLSVVNIQPSPQRESRPDRDTPIARRVRLAFDVYIEDPDFTPSCGGIVPVPPTCLVRYRFLRRESRDVELMPGQVASLNFTATEVAKLQAFTQAVGNPNEGNFPTETVRPSLVSSLEVREGTRTLFVVPALAKLFNPQPDPPGHQR